MRMAKKAHWGIVAAVAFIAVKFCLRFIVLTEEWYTLSALGLAFVYELVVFILYPGPFILYRYAIKKTYTQSKAVTRVVTYTYTTVLLLIATAINGGEFVPWRAGDMIWSEIAALILRDGCDAVSDTRPKMETKGTNEYNWQYYKNRTAELKDRYTELYEDIHAIKPEDMKKRYESGKITLEEYYDTATAMRDAVEEMQQIRDETKTLKKKYEGEEA